MKFFAKYVTILFALFALWQPATAQRATETTSIDYAYGMVTMIWQYGVQAKKKPTMLLFA